MSGAMEEFDEGGRYNPSCNLPRTKPYIRSALARTVYERMQTDHALHNLDKRIWYSCDIPSLSPDLQSTFLQLSCDNDTQTFLESCKDKADWVFTQIYYSLAKFVLSWFLTQTTVNGLLGRGSMFVFSRLQFQQLLSLPPSWQGDRLLDLGAGDGAVTMVMAPHFKEVHVTEMSTTMQWALQKKSYKVVDVDHWATDPVQYDVISCLNLLDRCDKPLTMLNQIKERLKPETGRLLLALVLPFKQYVEFGNNTHAPTETLPVSGRTFEDQVNAAVSKVFEPAGWTVERWSRVPYLCEGDLKQSYYWLKDVVLVLAPRHEGVKDEL